MFIDVTKEFFNYLDKLAENGEELKGFCYDFAVNKDKDGNVMIEQISYNGPYYDWETDTIVYENEKTKTKIDNKNKGPIEFLKRIFKK